jgi:hypothetical protein
VCCADKCQLWTVVALAIFLVVLIFLVIYT